MIIHFNRAEESARFGGVVIRGAGAIFDLCRELTNRGWWDEPVSFVDEFGMPCLESKSLHGCARRYRPTEAERAAKTARAAGGNGKMGGDK